MEKQTVLILETVLISIWLWKCPLYSTYIRDVFEKIETVPILETVLRYIRDERETADNN